MGPAKYFGTQKVGVFTKLALTCKSGGLARKLSLFRRPWLTLPCFDFFCGIPGFLYNLSRISCGSVQQIRD